MDAAFRGISDNEAIRGAIVTGAGDPAFVAGVDISEVAGVSPIEAKRRSAAGRAVFNQSEASRKPVVAAINGAAFGGGGELALAYTLHIASEHATFAQPEVRLGLIPGYGGTRRLARLVGEGRALQMILTGDRNRCG